MDEDEQMGLGLAVEDDGATGFEFEETSGSDEISEPFDPSLIRVETKTPTISLMLSRISRKEINLSPGFQRKGGIWTRAAQSRLIESLLIRIPLPAFYMDGTNDDEWLVVDGLQRLTALNRFVVEESLALGGLEFLKNFNGKHYSDLPRNFQRRIDETQVTVFVIQEKTPPEVKFYIFKRINTGGLPLSAQEIRHALYQGPASALLGELARSKEFLSATANGIRDDRMGDRECVLRSLAFMLTSPAEYRSSELDAFLNKCMADLNRMPPSQLQDLGRRFLRAMDIAHDVFGGHAFRKQYPGQDKRFPINKALLETWTVTFDSLDSTEYAIISARREQLRERFQTLLAKDVDFENSISLGTGDPRKVRRRFGEINMLVQELINAD